MPRVPLSCQLLLLIKWCISCAYDVVTLYIFDTDSIIRFHHIVFPSNPNHRSFIRFFKEARINVKTFLQNPEYISNKALFEINNFLRKKYFNRNPHYLFLCRNYI